MSNVSVTMALGDYDHVRDLIDGTVGVNGADLTVLRLPIEEMFHRFMYFREWDVSEMSFAKCVSMAGRGDTSVVPIPVFISRAFRLSSLYVRADSPLTHASELAGTRVGLPEWAQTAAVYTRGMLQHHYGIDLGSISWTQGGVNDAGRKEKASLSLPPHIRLTAEPDRSLTDLLLAGELDAVMSARPPAPFSADDGRIRRLVADTRTEELAYWRATGIFPIMHIVVLRRDSYERHRWLAANLVSAFTEAKDRSLKRFSDVTASAAPLPFLADYARLSRSLMGEDFWPYGVAPNALTLDAFFAYAFEQGVSAARVTPETFFAPETLSRVRV